MKWTFNRNINVKVAVLCLLGAATFWFFKALSHDHTTNISFPIKINYDKEKHIPIGDQPKEVVVNVTGYGWELLGFYLGAEKPTLVVNLDELKRTRSVTGQKLLPLISDQLEDFEINFLREDTVLLNFDELVSRKIRLTVSHEGLPDNLIFGRTEQIVPNLITIKGPKSLVYAYPDPFQVKVKAMEDGEELKDYEVNLAKQLDEKIKLSEETVLVTADINKYVDVTRQYPVELRHFPKRLKESIGDVTASINFTVDNKTLKNGIDRDFLLVADYHYYDRSTKQVPIKIIRYPGVVKNFSIEPRVLDVSNE